MSATTHTPAGITILGSTGSIGVSTLDVVGRHPQRFRVVALTANAGVDRLAEQCARHRPDYAVMADPAAAERLAQRLKGTAPDVEVLSGSAGLARVAALDSVDYVMAAIVGAAGLLPALAAARHGKHVLLANKEALVMSGDLFMQAVREHGATLLPIDSEHNAILQCLPDDYVAGSAPRGVRRILLTASGGPFRTLSLGKLSGVTPEQACAHPNWVMGRKISVDSATMMNKGLEVIEASRLFGLPLAQIDVVLHPQSVVHSLVEYRDGSVLAQLGNPDMRIPISHALGWPERIDSGAGSLDLMAIGSLQFEAPEPARYPCLQLAYDAMQAGGTAPALLNAANEVAVQAFLERRIPFTAIARVIRDTLERCPVHAAGKLDAILADDATARGCAAELINNGKVTMAR
jgi:1-deoxy-D-xylulose-5-phosphate reductoisomerase